MQDRKQFCYKHEICVATLLCLLGALTAASPVNSSDAVRPAVSSVTQITRDNVSKTNLISDGANLYVTEWPAGRHVIAKLEGSSRSLVSTPFPNVQALAASSDGRKLLVSPIASGSNDNEFWTVPTGTGTAERLGAFTGRDAAWSADGQYVVFSKGTDLYLADRGMQINKIFSTNESIFSPRFSPDGERIRFTLGSVAENTTTLWEVSRDGKNAHPLLPNWENKNAACCGTWTSDGRYYIFQVTQTWPTTITTLWVLPEKYQGTSAIPQQLTEGPISFGNPAPAADGKRLWAIGLKPEGEAVKYDSRTKQFAPLLSGVSATDLDFSADGKWVTYVAVPDGTLWRSRADGSDRRQLTFPPERVALPHWSPDGKWIAYVKTQSGKPWRISLISHDGGTAEDVFAEDRSQIDASWSPDGSHIMFGYVRDVPGAYIRIVDLATQKSQVLPGSEGLFSPRWSPDGRYVAALSLDLTKLMLFDFTTQKWTTWLSEPAGAVNYPTWSADSKYVYFDDLVTDEESMRRVGVNETHAESVLVIDGIERYPGPFGLWSGRTNDGFFMFVRDHSIQEVYELGLKLP